MPDQDREADLKGMVLSDIDIIKLHAAVTLSICGALHVRGLVSHQDMGAIFLAQVREDDTNRWASIVRAFAQTLTSSSKALEPSPSPRSRRARLTLVIGGLDQAKANHDS